MSIPILDMGGKLDLEVHIPVADGKCSCFFWRKVKYDGVVYDAAKNKLVAKEPNHMTEEEKQKTRSILSEFISNKVENDPTSFAAICKFIDFDADKSQTVKIRQIEKLKEILQAAEKEKLKRSHTDIGII